MLNNTVKTYACKKATPNSKNKTAKIDDHVNKNKKKFKEKISNKKLLIIKTKVCPAIILALKRIAILKALIP